MRVFITIRQKINHAIFYIRHMKAEFDHWASLPKLFGPILIIGWLAIFMTSWDMGYEAAELREKIGIQRSIAGAFEGAPAVMLQQIEAKKDTMSPYQYELKKAQQEFFAREAPKIAERIKSDAYWKIFVGVSKVATEQAAQMATGKLAGRAANYVGTRVGYQATKVGAKLAATRFRAAGRFIGSTGEELIWKSAQLGELADKSSNLIWELITAAARVDPATTPTLQKAMSKPEFAELFQLLRKATEKDPDKLMEAHLYHDIKWLEKKIFDADEYREFVIAMAKKYKKLTKEFGSSDSMWNDVEELAKWLANKAGRPLPEEPTSDEPEPEPASLANFTAHGEFTGLEEKLHYPADHWQLNSINIDVHNWKIVKGVGILNHEVKTPAIHTYAKHTFSFNGTLQQEPPGGMALGKFKNTIVIHTTEQYTSRTGVNETSEKRFSFTGIIYQGGLIKGTLNDWPGDYELESNIK